MQIRSIRHKGLRRFIEENDSQGIRGDLVDKVRKVIAVLLSAVDMHVLKDHLAGVFINFPVTALEHGVSLYQGTGALLSISKMMKFIGWIWRIITDERRTHQGRYEAPASG